MAFNPRPPSIHSQALDFNVQPGDDDSSFTCTPPNAYFASQVLRVGLPGRTTMHILPSLLPDRKDIEREIMKERIREEIIASEMAERRMLEDEVRRELEMERVMKTRLHMERRVALLAGTGGTVNRDNPMRQSFFPFRPQARSGDSRYSEHEAELTFRERSPPAHFRQKNQMIAAEESFLHQNSEKLLLPSEQKTTSNLNLSGAKRKTRGDSQLSEKQWACALCQVHTTGENSLKAHLEGKKHKTKEARLTLKNISRKEPLMFTEKIKHPQLMINGTLPLKGTSASDTTDSGSKNKQPLVKCASAPQTEGTSASGLKNKTKNKQPLVKCAPQTEGMSASGLKNKKQSAGGGPRKKFWCFVCRVKCNSENMLKFHLAGKKHQIFSEWRNSTSLANKSPADTEAPGFIKEVAGAQGFVEEVADDGAQGFVEEVADDGAQGFVEEVAEDGAGLTAGELDAGDLLGNGNKPLEDVPSATAAAAAASS